LVGDPHVQRHAWRKRTEIVGDADFAMKAVAGLAEEHRPLWVIFLGDVFDSVSPTVEDVDAVFRAVDDVVALGCRVGYLRGQHDLSKWIGRETRPWLSLHPACLHLDGKLFRIGSANFYGLDFKPAAELQKILSSLPVDTDVLLAHQCWQEHMPKGSVCEGSFKDIPHASIVATGDMHGHRATTVVGASGQKLTALSPGTLFMQSTDEDGSKYVFLLHDDLTFESVELPARSVVRYTIRNEEELEAAVREVNALRPAGHPFPPALALPLLVVRCVPGLIEARRRLEAACSPADGSTRAHLFYQAMAAVTPDAPAGPDRVREPVVLREFAARRAPELADMAARLAAAADPVREVATLVEEMLKEFSEEQVSEGEE
jgi:DNA repair exonuclease SbcCD nuclease subunit